MLALDVNLLTNKLQNQTLEEGPPGTSNIKLINSDVGFKLSESAQARIGGAREQQLYRVSLGAEAGTRTQTGPQSLPKMSNAVCSQTKLKHTYPLCEKSVTCVEGVAAERPKKRHSRSITVPQETEISVPPAKSTWQPQGTVLWKPVAIEMRNRSRTGLDYVWDVRTVRWPQSDGRNYEFSSLAPSVQRHRETGNITPEDLLTPPESPVPRPGSVYSDGAISPFMGDPYMDYTSKVQQIQEFRNRSLSIEDKISCTTMCFGGSASNVPGLNGSVPTSPHHRQRVPRCRSQPSFYDRKSGRRRRRDCRPTLNFNKMTETAYGSSQWPDGSSATNAETAYGSSQWPDGSSATNAERYGSRFHAELENAMSLMPIASSPQDSTIPVPGQSPGKPGNSPIYELESTHRDNVSMGTVAEETTGNSEPVKLLGDDDQDENDMEVFQLTEELDLEQIENH